MTDDFSSHPKTIGELRSDKTHDASSWSPRDVLVSTLREIDAGEIDPDALVVCWRGKVHDGEAVQGWAAASPDPVTTVGLLMHAAHRVIETK